MYIFPVYMEHDFIRYFLFYIARERFLCAEKKLRIISSMLFQYFILHLKGHLRKILNRKEHTPKSSLIIPSITRWEKPLRC